MSGKFARYRRRALLVANHTLLQLLLPLSTVLVSLSVIRLTSVELWGAFVPIMIIVHLVAQVVAWGNKEYLLRAFSLNPADLPQSWQTSLYTRMTLLPVVALVLSLMGWPREQTLLMLLWVLGLVVAQSADVLILYTRKFTYSILVELSATVLLLAVIVGIGDSLTVEHLLLLFAVTSLLKASALVWRFSRLIRGLAVGPVIQGRVSLSYFRLAFPFFLLGFSGMIQSRVDLYTVSYFLSPREVGQYQVFANFLIYLQATANFILAPFVKNLYRLGHETTLGVSRRMLLAGTLLIVPALAAIHVILIHVYRIEFPWWFLILGGLSVVPIHYYLPIIYALYKTNSQTTVLKVNLAGFALIFALNVYLVPRMGIMGALLSAAVVKWLVLIFYFSKGRAMRGEYALVMS